MVWIYLENLLEFFRQPNCILTNSISLSSIKRLQSLILDHLSINKFFPFWWVDLFKFFYNTILCIASEALRYTRRERALLRTQKRLVWITLGIVYHKTLTLKDRRTCPCILPQKGIEPSLAYCSGRCEACWDHCVRWSDN